MRLDSDFIDYYDGEFRPDSPLVYRRHSRGGMDRPGIFQFLQEHGLAVAPHGSVSQLAPQLLDANTPPHLLGDAAYRAQLGNEIELVVLPLVLRQRVPEALRLRRVGRSRLHLLPDWRLHRLGEERQSLTNWRSNVGDVTNTVESFARNTFNDKYGQHPIFSIRFAIDSMGSPKAVDFDPAPMLAGSGVEPVLAPAQVLAALERYYQRQA